MASTGYKVLRAISAVTAAEAAPTTASAWVNLANIGGHHYSSAKVAWTKPTLGNADNTCTMTLWLRQGTVILPILQAAMDPATDQFTEVDLGQVPKSASFFVTVSAIAGTTQSITTTAYIRAYTDDDAVG